MGDDLPEPDVRATAPVGSYYVALYPFESEFDEDLSLQVGDLVKITEYVENVLFSMLLFYGLSASYPLHTTLLQQASRHYSLSPTPGALREDGGVVNATVSEAGSLQTMSGAQKNQR